MIIVPRTHASANGIEHPYEFPTGKRARRDAWHVLIWPPRHAELLQLVAIMPVHGVFCIYASIDCFEI